MDKHGFIATIFILSIVSSTGNASLIFNLRRLITGATNDTSTILQVSPVGSPVSGPVNAGKSEKDKHKESEVSNKSNNSLTLDSKDSKKNDNDIDNNKNNTGTTSQPDGAKKGKLDDKGKGKVDNSTKTQLGGNDTCERSLRNCRGKGMIGCILASENGSKELFLLVQNEGESNLKVNVNFPNSMESGLPAFEVAKHQTKKIDISSTPGKSSKIILSSGNGNCVLDMASSVSVENFLRQFSFYSRQVTPIYVAFFFFLLALLCGGTWACCKLKKRRRHDGIPYKELEMGLPESTSAVNVETSEGWDQDWDDDDWDEDSAVKSPGGHNIRSISANGLTSRSSKKDGWDNDWDD
ncbi:unnamed protein product [Fraxinus pennsylvanica]|uniref:DUF7356 domain-containing protein n=1 Tax=Fraxinus pennsylvanica TaxID=56036 RepID=A0AAD2EAM6_9LAMI|nr:unnamed protein product [Fraxinus pennsylvanica]